MNALVFVAWMVVSAADSAASTSVQADPAPDDPCFIADVFSPGLVTRETIDLNGEWNFRRDPGNVGVVEGWQAGKASSEGPVTLPGVPQAQGYGEVHPHQRTYFKEPYWLWRSFAVRALKPQERLWFRLGAVLPAAELYINGRRVGYTKSSRTPERVDITGYARTGENLAAIKVCDFPEIRLDGILEWQEGTQHWTGVYRPVSCEITDRVCVGDVYIQPRIAESAADVRLWLSAPAEGVTKVELCVRDGDSIVARQKLRLASGAKELEARIPLKGYRLWSPADPKLYTLEIVLRRAGHRKAQDRVAVRFGMREIRADGAKILLNGKPIFWRAYGDIFYYPDTLSPPPDKEWYLDRLRIARSYGMNGVKGCVETINPEYLEAADEVGLLVIQEMPFGLGALRANRNTIDEPFTGFYAAELDGIVRTSRNHASVVSFSMSSELPFEGQTQRSFDFFSRELPEKTRALAPHALVIDCTGYLNEEDTSKGKRDTDFYASIHPDWMKEVLEETDIKTDHKHPMILHEYNWWSCYADPGIVDRYKDAQLLPFWVGGLLETAKKNGQEMLLSAYREASLREQAIERKDGLEYARRNGGAEGFIFWLLVDNGHWNEGLLDDFWKPKNVSAEELLQYNGDTVILLGKDGNRCLDMETRNTIPLIASHYGETDPVDSKLNWRAVRGAETLAQGSIPVPALKAGGITPLGDIVLDPIGCAPACKVELHVELVSANGAVINKNAWPFWMFPRAQAVSDSLGVIRDGGRLGLEGVFSRCGKGARAAIPKQARLVLADSVDEILAKYVAGGGACLLFSRGAEIENRTPYYQNITFHGLYRNIPWNAGNAGSSGTLVEPHPALSGFPQEGFCDLNWVWMIRGYYPIEFEPLRPFGVTPVIRSIDSFRANRNNAYAVEFKVGDGKVFATTLGILPNLEGHIEARNLLECLIRYGTGAEFSPPARVPRQEFVKQFSAKAGGPKAWSPVDREPHP